MMLRVSNGCSKFQIMQVDGSNDISALSTSTDGLQINNISNTINENNGENIAAFALNQEKQQKSICDDTQLNDFEVTINNNNENCIIKCSSGFYYQMGRPCFEELDIHSVMTYSNIAINVTEIQPFLDRNRYEYGRRLRLSFVTHDEDLGGVVVHLHHSTRRIQIQGGSTVSCVTSAEWFAKAMISRFHELAKP